MADWILAHGLDLLQSVGIAGSLFFSSYATWKDEQARRISNALAIHAQYREIWRELYERPELSRVLDEGADLSAKPLSTGEELFVRNLILHLGTAFRVMQYGEFVRLSGLHQDIREFFTLPIPRAIWSRLKPFQNRDFVGFIEDVLSA